MTSRSSFGSRGRSRTLRSSSRRGLVGLEPVDLLAGHRPHLVVAVVGVAHLARAGELARGSRSGGETPRRPARGAPAPGPSRRISFGSATTSGLDSSAWTSSYWRAISASLASRSLMSATAAHRIRGSARGRWPVGGGRGRGGRRRARARARPACASARARASASRPGPGCRRRASASSIEAMATSIMSSVGRLVVIIWTRMPGYMSTLTTGLPRYLRPELEDLVADRGDDRDEQQAADDHHDRRLPADQRERDDREQDHDDEELGAAALVGGRVLADLVDGQRVAGLEGVDRHVLGAVVLEDAADVRRARDEHQVAEEDRDPDEALDEVLDEPVLDVGGRDAGDEQRQQEEDRRRRRRGSARASARPSPCRARCRRPRPGRWRCGSASACRRRASRTGRRARARTATSAAGLPWTPESRRSVAVTIRPSGWRRATAIASRPRMSTPSMRAWPP